MCGKPKEQPDKALCNKHLEQARDNQIKSAPSKRRLAILTKVSDAYAVLGHRAFKAWLDKELKK